MIFSSSELAIIKMYLSEHPRKQVINKIESILPYIDDECMKSDLLSLLEKLKQTTDAEFESLDFSNVPDLLED